MASNIQNSGVINVTGEARANASAFAISFGGSGSANALAEASADVTATGIGINLGTLAGNITNSGALSVTAQASASVGALADGGSAFAEAFATDPLASAYGLAIDVGTLVGRSPTKV